MPHLDEIDPPCKGQPILFESTFSLDHRQAKQLCAKCPLALFTACERLAGEQTNHDGTWAGALYVNGRTATMTRQRAGRRSSLTA